ncbi:MAG: hypothetical protein ACREE7_00720 [Dongiaceae bacterium]
MKRDWLIMSTAAVLLAGCDGGNFASELAARPKPHPLKAEQGATLRLPQDEPFSIVFAPSQKAPALDGAAESDAKASREGSAEASAKVTDGGTAVGTFQLGHVFSNESDQQIELDIRVRFSASYKAEATPPSPRPEANVGLKLYARDGQNRLVRNIDLLGHSTQHGPATRQSNEDFRFTVTLGPRDTLSVFLAGQAEVKAEIGRSASASLALSDTQMAIITEPAPAVRTVSDERRQP